MPSISSITTGLYVYTVYIFSFSLYWTFMLQVACTISSRMPMASLFSSLMPGVRP